MNFIHKLEPLWWMLFAGGGFVASFFLPGLLIGVCLFAPARSVRVGTQLRTRLRSGLQRRRPDLPRRRDLAHTVALCPPPPPPGPRHGPGRRGPGDHLLQPRPRRHHHHDRPRHGSLARVQRREQVPRSDARGDETPRPPGADPRRRARRDVSERLFMSLLDASLSIPALQRILESVALLRQRLDVDTELVVLQCAGRHFDDADQPVVLVEREGHELLHRVASPGPRQRRRLHSTGWPTFRPTFFGLY